MEHLPHMDNLESLFLNHNIISAIEGIEQLKRLVELHLGYNHIERIPELPHLPRLSYLDLAHNLLSQPDDIHHLLDLDNVCVNLYDNPFSREIIQQGNAHYANHNLIIPKGAPIVPQHEPEGGTFTHFL